MESLNRELERINNASSEKHEPLTFKEILRKIDNEWVIPEFQRNFVWDIDKVILLFDSMYHGYNIGNIFLWKTNNKLAYRKIGGKESMPINKEKTHTYILDGQQRLTSIYGVLTGKELYRPDRVNPIYHKIYFDLNKCEFISEKQKIEKYNDKTVKKLIEEDDSKRLEFIEMSQIYEENERFPEKIYEELSDKLEEQEKNGEITPDKRRAFREELKKKKQQILDFIKIMNHYKIPQIVELTNSLDNVVTVFERINTQNIRLDIFDIMVAKTYRKIKYNNKDYLFNLRFAIKKILYNGKEKLNLDPTQELTNDSSLYDNIDNVTLLRLISICLNSKKRIALQKSDIDILNAQQIQENILKVRGILNQVKLYLSSNLNLKELDTKYINNKILSFLSYVFTKEDYRKIDSSQLDKWFWNTMIFNRYPGAQLQKIEDDVEEFNKGKDKFLEKIKDNRGNIFNTEFKNKKFIDARYDKQNNLYGSLILLLNSLKPKDFDGKIEVNLTDYIGPKNKDNKHHIIPKNSSAAKKLKSLFEDEKEAEFVINNIANISLITAGSNKEHGKKDPLSYLKDHEEDSNFYGTLETHLINKEMYEDLKNERYNEFLEKRTKMILKKINKFCKVNEEDSLGPNLE